MFSVSGTKKVCFSKGNLQLVGANIWQFADNQGDYFGSSQSDNHRDLFGWGTGNTPNLVSTNNDDYGTFTDWGNNAINNGGSKANSGWRTLTSGEWEYLFNTRTVNGGTGEGKSYACTVVNNVTGVVLYPDDYTGATYTGSNWESFENAGCVFLPAAGYRSGTSTSDVAWYCYYWSSMANGSGYAMCMTTGGWLLNPGNIKERYTGLSVRLVYDIK